MRARDRHRARRFTVFLSVHAAATYTACLDRNSHHVGGNGAVDIIGDLRSDVAVSGVAVAPPIAVARDVAPPPPRLVGGGPGICAVGVASRLREEREPLSSSDLPPSFFSKGGGRGGISNIYLTKRQPTATKFWSLITSQISLVQQQYWKTFP